jgi:hypothetical protein
MLTSDTGYLNERSTIVQPNDPLSLSLVLLDNYGTPIDLNGKAVRLRVTSRGTGKDMVATADNESGEYVGNEVKIQIYDPLKGSVKLLANGDVLNDPRGYRYTVEVKESEQDISLFKFVARGQIQVFNNQR